MSWFGIKDKVYPASMIRSGTPEAPFVPLVETMEGGKLLPLSIRCLAVMHLCDYLTASTPERLSRVTLYINPADGDIRIDESGPPSAWTEPMLSTPERSGWCRGLNALPVYTSLILIGAHPYRGRMWYENPLVTPEFEEEYFVTSPEFILATNSQAPNAPQPLVQRHVKMLFNSMPQELRTSFREIFSDRGSRYFRDIEGVRDFREKLFGIVSQIVGTPGAPSVRITMLQKPYILYEGKVLYSPIDLSVMGRTVSGKDGSLLLRNETDRSWRGENIGFLERFPARIKPGECLPLSSRLELLVDDDGEVTYERIGR